MNHEGITHQFEYQEAPGVTRAAWLTETKFTTFGTHDSQWVIDHAAADPKDWLVYLGTNGAQYRAKVHCEGKIRPHVKVWMENEMTDGSHQEPETKRIDIVDGSGAKWHVEILDVTHAPAAPQFKLTRL